MRNAPCLHPIPSQTRVNPWQSQCPNAYLQGSPAVLGPQEAVQLVTQRAREAQNDQRQEARRALLRQQEEFLAATRQHEANARQNLVSALAQKNEVHCHSSFQRFSFQTS